MKINIRLFQAKKRAMSASDAAAMALLLKNKGNDQVPNFHEDRYSFCSSVSVSMLIPMDLSLSLETHSSISWGTA